MIVDYLDQPAAHPIEADICIVGAGAAGLALAQAFISSPLTVCLIEGGGIHAERKSQQFYTGPSVGDLPLDPATSRLRAFGGSCNLWGGGCIPLDREDFTAREWVPHSGWPFSYDELAPYYDRARLFCHIDSHTLADGSFTTKPPCAPLQFDESRLVNRGFVSSPIVFGEHYRGELVRAPNITIVLHANLLELQARPDGGSIEHARIGAVGIPSRLVKAKHYVLACGGIENARQLLLSDTVCVGGLGNQHDLVGRFFMDHPCGNLGKLFTRTPDQLTRPYDHNHGEGQAPLFTQVCLSPAAQQAQRLLNGRVHPFPVEGPLPGGIRALRSLRAALRPQINDEEAELAQQLWAAMRHNPAPGGGEALATRNVAALLLRTGIGIGDIARAFIRKLADRSTVPSDHVALAGYFEQAPNPQSRITLAAETDALGQRKVCVDWQLTALDRHTFRSAALLFGNELARACNGHFEPEAWLQDDAQPAQVHGTAHHMGTTRMADNPSRGVVNRHCQVHGIDNLHIAGSSVFPTGGWAFPTLTIVALSLRLADRLRARIH